MSASKIGNPDITALHDDIAALKRDVASLIDHLKLGMTSNIHDAAEPLDEGARQIYRDVAAKGERSIKAAYRQVEENPMVALLLALGIGYIGGRMLSR